jgi:polysaccharide export outer membrane protein
MLLNSQDYECESTMKKILIIILFITAFSACSSGRYTIPEMFQEPASTFKSYRIGHGDILNISVWKEAALTKQVTVLPDGNIVFPLIGEIKAYGKTAGELQKKMEGKLEKYMPDSSITVEVIKTNSMMIFIIGKVNSPGNYILQKNITVMKALTLARGLTIFAEKENIKIFRKVNGEDFIFQFNYDEVVKGRHLEQNIILKRDDMIVVP